MRYSSFGKTGLEVSALGFGCMRLPMTKDNKVDRDLSTPLLRRAVELGVNFFDSAVMYCNSDSQAAIGEALEGLRDKVIFSTKNHHHNLPADQWRKALEDSLRFLRTDHIDVYNHHGINWDLFKKKLDPDKGGLTAAMLKAKEEGLVRHVGFSFHAPPDHLMKLADTGIYESVILQYNLLDQANPEAIHYASEKGMGIVVMGPVGGGRLGIPSDQLCKLTGASSTPEAALRFVWAHPSVNIALSGMQNMDMLEQNVQIADNTQPFTRKQIDGINNLVEERKKKSGLYCTDCKYCMPACPNNVSIPEQLDLLNHVRIYGLRDAARDRYTSAWGPVKVRATECVNCGKCIEKCPQNINIPERLREVITELDPDAGKILVNTVIEDIQADGTFKLRFRVRSLVANAEDCSVRITTSDDTELDNSTLDFSGLGPFARKNVTVSGKIPKESSEIALDMDLMFRGESLQSQVKHSFVMLNKGLDDSWDGGEWFEAAPGEGAFTDSKDTAGKHGLRLKVSHDDEGILLLADVKDDFLFPTCKEKHADQNVDNLDLFLDARPTNEFGEAAHSEGVSQIKLYPGTPGKYDAFATSRNNLAVDINSEATETGYRLKARVPFLSFMKDGKKPKRIGLDVAVSTADKEGKRVGYYVWSGTQDDWKDASKYKQVFLV